jgi:antitoxin (DNA-binding transcriptional repressor) of toxin-antitoxin stability system
MKAIQTIEIEEQFFDLLDQVEAGETVAITRRGRAVGWMVPEDEVRREDAFRAIAEIRAAQNNAPQLTLDEIIARKNAGRE